jgi:ribosomal subunit interface protein
MQIQITGKNLDIGDALREHVENRINNDVAKYFDGIVRAHDAVKIFRHIVGDPVLDVFAKRVANIEVLAGDLNLHVSQTSLVSTVSVSKPGPIFNIDCLVRTCLGRSLSGVRSDRVHLAGTGQIAADPMKPDGTCQSAFAGLPDVAGNCAKQASASASVPVNLPREAVSRGGG